MLGHRRIRLPRQRDPGAGRHLLLRRLLPGLGTELPAGGWESDGTAGVDRAGTGGTGDELWPGRRRGAVHPHGGRQGLPGGAEVSEQLEFGTGGRADGQTGGEPVASPLPPRELLAEWRSKISPLVRFGTSTWTYPGWHGLIYSRPYPEQGASAKMLAEYARFPLFGTVGIDSSFYGPPKPKTLESWARVLPDGFPCVSKVWDRLTVHTFSGKREPASHAGRGNPDFLNPNVFLS